MNKISNPEYLKILKLQDSINRELMTEYQNNIDKDNQFLAERIIKKVEEIIDNINSKYGYNFGRCDYSGDINYQDSEQTYSNGKEMGSGIILHFHGFSVQASWEQ